MQFARRSPAFRWTPARTKVRPAEWISAWDCLWLCGLGGLLLLVGLYWSIEQEVTLPWPQKNSWGDNNAVYARQNAWTFSGVVGTTFVSGLWLFIQGLLALGKYRALRRQRFWRRHHRYRLQPQRRHPASADFADTQPWAYAVPPEFADTEPMSWPPDAHPAPRH